ncbi:histidinol dehydrogenase [Oceanobacillus sp. CAU 1775]
MRILSAEEFYYEWTNGTEATDNNAQLDEAVLNIIQNVRKNKDEALLKYTEAFDGVKLDSLLVSSEEFKDAKEFADESFLEALDASIKNIRDFHDAQKEKSWMLPQNDGSMLGQIIRPIERVGVYVPGGKAGYPSTVLMTVIPAQIAGVEDIVITSPTDTNGKVNPYVLLAAQKLGVTKVYKVGGAQAIAAFAYGTESIKKVDKIAGPGNAYVARAKKWVYGEVGIDMIAGPSEICVIADERANPAFVAADLLSQAEHDESARAFCITTSESLAKQIQQEVELQAKTLDRHMIIDVSIQNNGKIILAENLTEAVEIANIIAPEHLELMVDKPMEVLPLVKHAGSIFLGDYSPEPLGDYFAGPNHTLPTNGTARFASPLGVYDFIKRSSIISYSEQSFNQAADKIITLANTEGLTAHAHSIQIRKEQP